MTDMEASPPQRSTARRRKMNGTTPPSDGGGWFKTFTDTVVGKLIGLGVATLIGMGAGSLLMAGRIGGDVEHNAQTNVRQDEETAKRVAVAKADNDKRDARVDGLTEALTVVRISLGKLETRLSVAPTPGLKPDEPAP